MPGGKDPVDRPGSSESPPSSPATSRFAPIIEDDEERISPTQTPDSRSIRTGTTYGSIDPHDTDRPRDGGSTDQLEIPSSSRTRSPIISPQRQDKSKKPPNPRRKSMKKPHRGQEFSVHDDVSEYEEDKASRNLGTPQHSPRINPLRRQSSTLRRRLNSQTAGLGRVDDSDDEDEDRLPEPSLGDGNNNDDQNSDGDDDDDDDVSDAESFTLKDRQQAINETHPFGIRIWKPAVYKKNRSVVKNAEGEIHSSPGGRVSNWLFGVNLLWTLFFGWWLAIVCLLGAIGCFIFIFSSSAASYGKIFVGLAGYLFYPFGSFVRLESEENYAEEDEGEGRSISEYEQWQSGDLEHGRLFFGPVNGRSLVGRRRNSIDSAGEHDSLLGRMGRGQRRESPMYRNKRRLFGRGEWTFGRVVFYVIFYCFVAPMILFVSLLCWFLVFWIPMGRITYILFHHLRRHPLALSFKSDHTYTRIPMSPSSSILLCTYRGAGLRYWKYTLDGTNIFFINLLAVVLFAIVDYWVLGEALGIDTWLTNPGLIFALALVSIIPLAYFIGQAVASISAQSSMGLGAAVNAFFSTIVEVYLYCVALSEGKAQLVEGSIIGSIFVGILFLPGLSMCFGAIKRKTQRFNVKSAGVTSTMLLFAVIAAFGPTLFYQIYGTHELNCRNCSESGHIGERDCRRCYFSQVPAISDKFFNKAVKPYALISAVLLFLSYIIGLWFTLRTHAAVIWAIEAEEKKMIPANESAVFDRSRNPGLQGPIGAHEYPKNSIRESQMYKNILGKSLKQVGLSSDTTTAESSWEQLGSGTATGSQHLPHVVPPKSSGGPNELQRVGSAEMTKENQRFVRHVTEVAATAAATVARDAVRHPKKNNPKPPGLARHSSRTTIPEVTEESGLGPDPGHASSGGHDAPNWSKVKSSVILLTATVAYAVIAEMLVNTVDVVLDSVDIDEKFLGMTLFALVPNTTEFLNAISFAMNGNIALSMEIGSAYALQVCLLQVPALVFFSTYHTRSIDPSKLIDHSFNLIFPQWDMVTVILCVFLLSYMYGEGKSNYFKGSILVLTYLVVMTGFYLSGFNSFETMGVDRFDTLAAGTSQQFRTVGQSSAGRAF
ncbi:hypothetical protein FQN54_002415 [Arachnomyces sp. PD_36]|nr:hypothetical protein FQN54_002415 [Arachnomyces sp. PD_36]